MHIEIREAHAFSVLAESLSFTKAAASLGVSQSALSQTITRLETKVGFALLRRSSRMVILTPAGETVLVAVRRLLQTESNLQETVQAMTTATDPSERLIPVRIGVAMTLLLGFLPQVLSQVDGILPLIRRMGESRQSRAFAHGELDIGFQRVWETAGPGLISVGSERLLLACHADHPMATASAVHVSDVANDRLLLFPREVAPVAYDTIIRALSKSGRHQPFVRHYEDEGELLGLVACRVGVGIVPESMARLRSPDIAYVRMAGPEAVSPIAIRYDSSSTGTTQIAQRLAAVASEVLSARRR